MSFWKLVMETAERMEQEKTAEGRNIKNNQEENKMIISKKKFETEVNKKVDEAVRKLQENVWRDEREREKNRFASELEQRIIALEKKNGIEHPSHGNVRCY